MYDEITYPFPNFNDYTVEVWETISNSIPHLIMDLITYAGCDTYFGNRFADNDIIKLSDNTYPL